MSSSFRPGQTVSLLGAVALGAGLMYVAGFRQGQRAARQPA